MATLFLMLIYLSFISLGLPDSILGSAWPVMQVYFDTGLNTAGVISFVVTAGTIVSSLLSGKLVRRFGTGKVTVASVLATALALLGYSISGAVWQLMAFAVPLGLGAGAVDSVLNNYVALHYKPRHMSWLHSFWGLGAFGGPIIMGLFLQNNGNWQGGYQSIGFIQLGVCALLFLFLPMWKQRESPTAFAPEETTKAHKNKKQKVIAIPGVVFALITFFFYCSLELSMGLWGSSFLVKSRGFRPEVAATAVSVYYGGITVGRILTGFLTIKLTGGQLIRAGAATAVLGGLLMFLPFGPFFSVVAMLFVGLGCAPVYPSMIHETPARFGAENSQEIIGLQMASAYAGSTLMPIIIGFVAARLGTGVLPVFVLIFSLAVLGFSQQITKTIKKAGGSR